jgi:hypothetical protein
MNRGVVCFFIAALCAPLIFATGANGTSVDGDAVAAGSLTMTSDVGDYVGQGQSYSFATPSDQLRAEVTGANDSTVQIFEISPDFSHSWRLVFSAPDGQQLMAGSYPGAVRDVSRGPGQPGLDISGDGRGCNTLTGSFTVVNATYGPYGYVESFDATFEQHCEGNIPALRGEIRISNTMPPPPPATVHVSIDPTGELGAHGTATVHGTITCSVPPNDPFDPSAPMITLTVTEQTKNGTASFGTAAYPSACTPAPTAWQATTPLPYKGTPYVKGAATVTAATQIPDPIYPLLHDSDSETAGVQLTEG